MPGFFIFKIMVNSYILETNEESFNSIMNGRTFDILKNQFDYQNGDYLSFKGPYKYSGYIRAIITDVITEHEAIKKGYCILSFQRI